MRGWVYIITNSAMPDLVKVGYSTKDPDLRAAELGHTGSPHPYVVVYELLIRNPYEVEQRAHAILRNFREGKEWFRCTLDVAVQAVRQATDGLTVLENLRVTLPDPPEIEADSGRLAREQEINRQEVFRLKTRIHNIPPGNTDSGIVRDELARFVGPQADESEIDRCLRSLSRKDTEGMSEELIRKSVIAVRVKMTVGASHQNILKMLQNSLPPEISEDRSTRILAVLSKETGYPPDHGEP